MVVSVTVGFIVYAFIRNNLFDECVNNETHRHHDVNYIYIYVYIYIYIYIYIYVGGVRYSDVLKDYFRMIKRL